MWGKILVVLFIALALALSVQQKKALFKKRNQFNQLADAPVSSFLSESLAHLVGVAGGIYLSLTLIVSFLEIDIPGKISVAGITMQPLAMTALALTILQPVIKLIFTHPNK